MIYKEKTVCFTGHRLLKENQDILFSTVYNTVELLIKDGYLYFCTGGARGFDALAAEVVLCLKAKYPNIHLILVLPFQNHYEHEKTWNNTEIEQLETHKNKASRVIYTQEAYSRGCYYKRDRQLVDHSSVCIAYQYKNSGGTAYTTKYAIENGLKVINIK